MNDLIEKSFINSIKCDIIKELLNKYESLDLDISLDDYTNFIINRVNIYSEHPNFVIRGDNDNIYISRNITKNKKDKCNARLWNNSYGGQCSHLAICNNYCKKHDSMIKKYGKLRFGDINDDIYPEKDYLNDNILNWSN